jgi:hypothetical protein
VALGRLADNRPVPAPRDRSILWLPICGNACRLGSVGDCSLPVTRPKPGTPGAATGCIICVRGHGSGNRSGREAGLRYAALRAPRGRGRFPPLIFLRIRASRGTLYHGTRTRARRPQAGGPEARGSTAGTPRRPACLQHRQFAPRSHRHRRKKPTKQQTTIVAAGDGRPRFDKRGHFQGDARPNPYLQPMDTEIRGQSMG